MKCLLIASESAEVLFYWTDTEFQENIQEQYGAAQEEGQGVRRKKIMHFFLLAFISNFCSLFGFPASSVWGLHQHSVCPHHYLLQHHGGQAGWQLHLLHHRKQPHSYPTPGSTRLPKEKLSSAVYKSHIRAFFPRRKMYFPNIGNLFFNWFWNTLEWKAFFLSKWSIIFVMWVLLRNPSRLCFSSSTWCSCRVPTLRCFSSFLVQIFRLLWSFSLYFIHSLMSVST